MALVAGKIGMKAARDSARKASGISANAAKIARSGKARPSRPGAAPTFQTSSPKLSVSADQAVRRLAAAERQATIERNAGISTNVRGGSKATAANTAPRTASQLADDARMASTTVDALSTAKKAESDHMGLTMEQANDPKYWKDGKFVGPSLSVSSEIAAPTLVSSPVTAPAAPTSAPERPILTVDTSKYHSYQPEAVAQADQPSLQTIRQEQIDLAQDAIDATQAAYQADLRRLSDEGKGLSAVTSSYAVSAGLAGSPFQQAMEKRQLAENNRVLEAAKAQRAAAVSGIMQQAEQNAQAYYQSAMENFRAEREWNASEEEKAAAERKAVADANQKAANDFIVNVAKAGQSIDDIPQEDYASLLDASGYTDFEARAIWSQNTPEANANYEMQDGKLVMTYFDPVTRKPIVRVSDIPGLSEQATQKWATKDIGGITYWIDENEVVQPGSVPTLYPIGKTKATEESMAGGMGSLTPTQASAIRKEIAADPAIQQFTSLNATFNSMDSLAKSAAATGDEGTKAQLDQAMITLFNKMLDPDSVVREGEYARTLEGQSLLAQAQGYVERLAQGSAGIADETRQAMVDTASVLFGSARDQYDSSVSFYKGVLGEYDADPSVFIRDVSEQPTGTGKPRHAEGEIYSKIMEWARNNPDDPDADVTEEEARQYDEEGRRLEALGYSDEQILGFINEALASKNEGFSGDLGRSGKGSMGSFKAAIAKMESGGNYKAIGPVTSSGDKAYGKYQVMGANIPSWTREALGKTMTPAEFLADPDAQEKVAEYKFQKYYDQYGNWGDVASLWFSGRPIAKAGNAKDVLGTSVPKYVQNILSLMG